MPGHGRAIHRRHFSLRRRRLLVLVLQLPLLLLSRGLPSAAQPGRVETARSDDRFAALPYDRAEKPAVKATPAAFDKEKFQSERLCDSVLDGSLERPPPIGDVLCQEGHSAEEYLRQARGILAQQFPADADRVAKQGRMPTPLKVAFLTERLLRCSLVHDSSNSVTWALLSQALQLKLRHSRGFLSTAVSRSVCTVIKWALQLSPTNPEVLDVAALQLRALAELWKTVRLPRTTNLVAGTKRIFESVEHPDIPRLHSTASVLEQRLYLNFSSNDASEYFQRGCLLESRGAQYAIAAQESFVAAWQLEPNSEQYATTAFLVLRATRPTAEVQSIVARFARSKYLANFRAWDHKASAYYLVENEQTQKTTEPANDSLFTAISAAGLFQLSKSDLIIEPQYAEAHHFVRSLKAFIQSSATPTTCDQVQQRVGPAGQRMGLVYRFPRFISVLMQLDKFMHNHSASGDMRRETLLPHSWSFKALNPESEQHFPALLANLLFSVCASKNISLHKVAHIMDVDAVQRQLLENKSLSLKQDVFGNTAWHIAAAQADAATLEALHVATKIVPTALNMWGDSFADIVCAWGRSVPQLAQWQTALQCKTAQRQAHTQAESSRCEPPMPSPKGWLPTADTIDWKVLGSWEDPLVVDSVDARRSSLADLIHNYFAKGRPVVLRNALLATAKYPTCIEAQRLWDKHRLATSAFALESLYHPYRIPYGNNERGETEHSMSLSAFIKRHMGVMELNDTAAPKYFFDNRLQVNAGGESALPSDASPVTQILQCIPFELQEYLNLPPAGLPGAWRQWTLGFGSSGSGAPLHVHESAVNLVVYGTKRWFVYPPNRAEYSSMPIFEWLRDVYPHLSAEQKPLEFVQRTGDIVFLPPWWGHATVSIGDCISLSRVLANPAENPDNRSPPGPLEDR
eukprot:INCI9903.3.p1 GENE.INCI9903.3~~INCI9903.3.p1  ORF type:complete len:914 (+),score=125.08 INCI9903.3:211-2952(+)